MIPLAFILICLILGLFFVDLSNKSKRKKPKYKIEDEMSFFDDYLWVSKVLNSCKTRAQLYSANELIYILKNKYKNKVDTDVLRDVNIKLDEIWDNKINQVK